MRRAHDPAGFGGTDFGCSGEPQHHAGDAGGASGKREFSAGHRVKRFWLAPQLGDDGTECVAGKTIGGGTQRHLGIVGAHSDDETRIESQFDKTGHRQFAGLKPGKALRDPQHEAAVLRDAPCERERKTGCGGALPALLRKDFVQRAEREPALQDVIGKPMAKRHTLAEPLAVDRLQARHRASQRRECIHAGASHLRRS